MNNGGIEGKINSSDKLINKLGNSLKKPQTLEEYFMIIGVEPKISTFEELYTTPINTLNEKYSKKDFKPKILSKFPPIDKTCTNINDTIIDLCFPNGFKLLKFDKKPKSIFQHFILDNSFYSIEYPLKYISCLKIYESLNNYYLLNNEIKKQFGNNSNNENGEIQNNDSNNNEFKNYYFPKVLCMVSTQHLFKAQEEILIQIYNYYINKNNPKNIPIEKILLTILFNIPLPPRGTLEIEYNLMDNYQKIHIKNTKMNKLPVIKEEIKLILNKFDEKVFLEIFKYVLFETKILIFGSNINEISYFIYGLISLLFPFKYPFSISSSIPNNIYNVVESISPYIFGINKIFKKKFFKENKIDISDIDLLIIDLDKSTIKFLGKKILPDFPRFLFKPLYEGLYNINKIKVNLWSENEFSVNYKTIRRLFFDFFINLLENYDLYIKNDYFKAKQTNKGLNNLYKIDEFINSHRSNDRNFYKKITETQMFNDFIYRKMLPKDNNEKLDALLFDESIIKKLNKKLFSKKKSCVFLNSKDYDYNKIYEIPHSKTLSKEEKIFFSDENHNKYLLNYGQKINIELNKEKNEKNYNFEYYLFPVLNNSFFDFSPSVEYFLVKESSIFSEIDRINTDILSKSFMNSSNNITNKCDEEMKNYIYLSYLELWAYNYWYLDSFEKDQKFKEMMDILSKISFHETELFDYLFESLNKFKEKNKIIKLYNLLLHYHIPPSSYIYNTVNSYINKNMNKSASTANYTNTMNYIKNKKYQQKTFHSIKDGKCLGDKIKFFNKQKCPECGQEIDITEICLDFKNMKKDFFWAKCPKCEKYIIPKLGVILGTEIINKEENQDLYNDYYSSNYNRFILHSPYELKINLKKIKQKDEFKMFHIEKFQQEYPSLYWSCIWYFKLFHINFDIILPYESTISKEIFNIEKYNEKNIEPKVSIDKPINNLNIINNNKKLNNSKKKQKKHKIFLNNNLLIHNIISISIIPNYEKNTRNSYYYHKISDNIFRKSTDSNKSTIYNSEVILGSNRESSINLDNKKNKFKSCTNFASRVRLYTLTSNYLLSPTLKSRKLFDNRSSADLISIKENEENNNIIFLFSASQEKEKEDEEEEEEEKEEKEEKEENEDELFFKTNTANEKKLNTFNFNVNDYKLNNKYKLKRNNTFEKIKKYKILEYNKNISRNKSVMNIRKIIF